MAARGTSVWRVLAGALVWAIHFMASYGLVTILCTRGVATVQWAGIGLVHWTVGALTVIAFAMLAAIALPTLRRDEFVDRVAAGVAALAALAIAWEAWLVMEAPPCA